MILIILFFYFTTLSNAQLRVHVNLDNGFFHLLDNDSGYISEIDSVFMMNKNQLSGESEIYYRNRIKLMNKKHFISMYSIESSLLSLQGTSQKNRDSIIYADIKKVFEPSGWLRAKNIFYKISPIQHSAGFSYVDIFETIYRDNGYNKYLSSMRRIFLINGIEYHIVFCIKERPITNLYAVAAKQSAMNLSS